MTFYFCLFPIPRSQSDDTFKYSAIFPIVSRFGCNFPASYFDIALLSIDISSASVCWLIPYSVLASFSLIAKVSLYSVIPPLLP